jgi:hypothetical protein
VHSDDPVQPQFTLTMKGSLLVDVAASPAAVTMRDVKVGAQATQAFELKLSETTTAKIVSVTLEDPKHFELRRTAGEAEGNSTYEVKFRGAKQVGMISTKIRVITTGESTPEFVIPVSANVVLNLRYQKTLRFTRREGQLQGRMLRISAREGDAPKLKKLQDRDGLLEIEVLEARGAMASVRVAVDEAKYAALDEKARIGSHELIISTSDRDEPRLVIEYSIAPPSSPGVTATATATGSDPHAQ